MMVQTTTQIPTASPKSRIWAITGRRDRKDARQIDTREILLKIQKRSHQILRLKIVNKPLAKAPPAMRMKSETPKSLTKRTMTQIYGEPLPSL
jgi:hypothetical protein